MALTAYQQDVRTAAAAMEPIVIQKAEQIDAFASVSVPLVVPFAYPSLDAAKKVARAAEAGYGVSEAQLLFGVAQSFYAAAGTDEIVGARRHGVEVADRTFKDARSRFEAGVVNRVHVMRAQLALERAQQAEAEALDANAQAYRALATLLSLHEPFKVAPPEKATAGASTSSDLVPRALEARPELRQMERTIDAARAQTSAAAWRWAPSLSAFGLVRAFNYKGFAGDNYAWAVGAQLDWLLYDGGARDAQRKQSAALVRENELRLSIARDQISDEVRNAERALATKRRALATAQSGVTLSRETLSLVRAQYDAGTATQLDLLQAQDQLVAAEVGLAQSRFELSLADLALERTVGDFPTRKGP
jgi:outer membrane protein TolC